MCAVAFFSFLLIDGMLMFCSFVALFSFSLLSWSLFVVWSFGSFVVVAVVGVFLADVAKKPLSPVSENFVET